MDPAEFSLSSAAGSCAKRAAMWAAAAPRDDRRFGLIQRQNQTAGMQLQRPGRPARRP